jgi:excisionase family DNA binding protein
MPTEIESLWDVQELSDKLRVKPSTVYSWVQLGYIPHVRLGSCVRFRPTDVAAWVNQHVQPGRKTREPILLEAQDETPDAVGAVYE